MNARALAFPAAVLAAAVALAASLWTWGLPLTNDGPTHVFAAYVAGHIEDPRFAPHYEVATPITSRGFHEVQRALEPLFGWRDAWRIHTIVMAELWAFGFLAFVLALARDDDPHARRRRRWIGLLGFALVLNGFFYLGLVAFTWACALSWWVLAAWLAAPARAPAARHALLAAALYVVAVVHVAAAAFAGLLLVALAASVEGRALLRRVAFVALAGVPALGVFALTLGDATAAVEPDQRSLSRRFVDVWMMIPAGPAWRCALAAALAGAGVAGAVRAARFAPASPTASATSRTSVVAVVGLAYVLLAWALPSDVGGWQYAGLRSAPIGVALLCAALPLADASRVLRTTAAAALAVFVVGTLAWSFSLHARMREANEPLLAVVDDPAVDGSDWTTIVFGPPLGTWPLPGHLAHFHLHHLLALEHGGRVTYGHDSIPSAHHLRARWLALAEPPPLPTIPDEALRPLAVRTRLVAAARHQRLLLVGTDVDVQAALDAGFVTLARSARSPVGDLQAFVGAFEGCHGSLRLIASASGPPSSPPIAVDVGWFPMRTVIASVSHVGADATYALPPLGCGEVWVASSTPGVTCAGQTPDAPVRATFTRAGDNVITCRIERGAEAPP